MMNPQELLPFFRLDNGRPPVVKSGKVFFLNPEETERLEEQSDLIYRIKNFLKNRMGSLYVICVEVISPVCPRIHWRSGKMYWRHVLDRYLPAQKNSKQIIIQIGSGSTRLRPEILNVDICAYPEVDIVADCTRLPFLENSIDGAVSLAVLEHVDAPELFVRDAFRALKSGGKIINVVPFMLGYHASPDDFFRWTANGTKALHEKEGFKTLLIEPLGGPTSSLLWILRDWLAVVFSFGLPFLYYPLLSLFTVLVAPFKFLDILLVHSKPGQKIGSAFIYVGEKP